MAIPRQTETARLFGDLSTIQKLSDEYLDDRFAYFTDADGEISSTPFRMACALKYLRKHYGSRAAEEFGPLMLEEFQRHLIEADLSRGTVNRYCHEVKAFFRWCVSKEKIDIAVHQALCTVAPLRRRRSRAKEPEPVRSVQVRDMLRLKPHLSRRYYSLIWLHYYSAARPGELINLRPCDIEQGEHVWTVRLDKHKNDWRGKERVIVFGRDSQALLMPLIASISPADYIFSPDGGKRPYVVESWRRAIHSACDRAGVPRWHPNQIRHASATMVREKFGLEAAQAFLGHSNIATTQIYAEKNLETAHKIAREIG